MPCMHILSLVFLNHGSVFLDLQALINNKDLARAAIAVNSALYSANLVGANLVPAFSASTSSTASKNIETGGKLKH